VVQLTYLVKCHKSGQHDVFPSNIDKILYSNEPSIMILNDWRVDFMAKTVPQKAKSPELLPEAAAEGEGSAHKLSL
jgi:hypothetical protein